MKGSFKSQLNYADIHQSPMLKCFFHKILKLLSAVTNCSSHNPRGLKEQARSLFFARDAPAKHHLMVPQSSFPAHGSSGEVQRTSTASSFPGSVLFLPPPAPDKRGPSINSNIQTTSLQACESSARPEMGVIVSSPLAALVHEINPLVFTGCATPSAQAGT